MIELNIKSTLISILLLLHNVKLYPAVELFVLVGEFFYNGAGATIADGLDTGFFNTAKVNEVFFNSVGSILREFKIGIGVAIGVSVAFNTEFDVRIIQQKISNLV